MGHFFDKYSQIHFAIFGTFKSNLNFLQTDFDFFRLNQITARNIAIFGISKNEHLDGIQRFIVQSTIGVRII